MAVDSAGNLYIFDGFRVRKITNGVITTVAGTYGTLGFRGDNGPATSALLNEPSGVAVDAAGNLYIADTYNHCVRKVSNGVITTVAGTSVGGTPTYGFGGDNGPATSASLTYPQGVTVDSAGNLYVADSGNFRLRRVSGGVITTVAGNGTHGFSGDNGPATSAQLPAPRRIAAGSAGNLYIYDSENNRIRKVTNGVITTVAGNGTYGFSGDDGPAISAKLSAGSLAVDSAGNLYFSEETSYNEVRDPDTRIRKVAGGVITTVAGNGAPGFSGDNGPATSAQLSASVLGVAVDSAGNLYIADSGNNRIRKVTNGVITTVAGNGTPGFSGDNGPASSAQLNFPYGVAMDSSGNLYIGDAGNSRIRKVNNGVITTVAGNGTPGPSGDNGPATSAQLSVGSLAVDSAGSLYLGPGPDPRNSRMRKVTNGVITTVAGNGSQGFNGDNGPATNAQFLYPQDIAVDSAGNVYIADTGNGRIRVLTPGTLPAIKQGGVVPVYSSVSAIQSSSWVSIYGTNLASGNAIWNGDFPTSLGGTSVIIDNNLTYLWFVSPFQINLQVPDDTAMGPVSVAVTTASGTTTSTVTLAPQAPSFSLLGDNKHVAAEIATPNGTGAYAGGTYDLVGPSNTWSFTTRPVKAGETLTLFGVGFGPTTPSVLAGKTFSGSASTKTPVTVSIGGINAPVSYSGITEAGLYQINLTVPIAPSGDQPVQATINGVKTPPGPVVTIQ